MRVLIDTPLWSLALRRRPGNLGPQERRLAFELGELIREGRAVLIGPIRQEVLSGIRDDRAFERLRAHLHHFEDESLESADFEEAARCGNRCRSAGIQGSTTDFLVCAVALRRGLCVFTSDGDFASYARCLALQLHGPRAHGEGHGG